MSFIKRGGIDGKIVSVIDAEELTEAQKKAAKHLSDKTIESIETDNKVVKESTSRKQ